MASIHSLFGARTRTRTPHEQDQEQAQAQERGHEHEHAWATESRHPTSAGWVLYVRCVTCGMRRVDVQDRHHVPPAPLSRVVDC
jgi:hypothetical protein